MPSLTPQKKIYFASDFHLGDNSGNARKREKRIVQWLDSIADDAAVLYLVGDIFDFWFEYHKVVPRGHTRFLGKLASMSDAGVEIHIFTGNHDMWMYGYLEEEIGAQIHYQPITVTWNNKQFYIGHGDGLGPGDKGYKIMKKIFTNKLTQWLFARIHPNLAISIMQYFSNLSREDCSQYTFKGNDKEWLVQYCLQYIKTHNDSIDYFIFGHRHIAVDIQLPNSTGRYINLGEWIYRESFASFDGKELTLSTKY